MRKLLFLVLISSLLFSCPIFAAVTTSDGMITLDLSEDTQSGIEDRWILSLTVNDIEGLGDPGKDNFLLAFENLNLNFKNEYNPESPDYSITDFMYGELNGIGGSVERPSGMLQCILSETPITDPISYTFYGLFPGYDYAPSFIMGNADVNLFRDNNDGLIISEEGLQLPGPLRVVPVPEPSAIALSCLGLAWLARHKLRK